MRIATNTMTYNFLSSMNKSLNRMNTLQEQLSDGKAIHRPSDDPVKAIRSLKLNTNLTQNEQFTQNVKDALSWLETTDGSLTDISSIIIRAKELIVRAGSPSPGIAYETAGEEVDQLINQLINIANTQIGDRYIFAGQRDKMTALPVARTADAIVYNGDNNKISMPVQPGEVNPEQDSVNVTALEVFGPNLEVLTQLIEVKNQLKSGTPDVNYLTTTALQNVDAAHDRVLAAQTHVGTRMAMYELSDSFLQGDNVTITANVSANEDLDVARAMIDFKTNENIYRMALSVGARIMPASLADFLK
ncbi:MAG: flagellar hook-associated protein FlgL [Negativicutes bacterium]|nr:flagellar hook-associated protein FlgL [Negativicutes bacterium]